MNSFPNHYRQGGPNNNYNNNFNNHNNHNNQGPQGILGSSGQGPNSMYNGSFGNVPNQPIAYDKFGYPIKNPQGQGSRDFKDQRGNFGRKDHFNQRDGFHRRDNNFNQWNGHQNLRDNRDYMQRDGNQNVQRERVPPLPFGNQQRGPDGPSSANTNQFYSSGTSNQKNFHQNKVGNYSGSKPQQPRYQQQSHSHSSSSNEKNTTSSISSNENTHSVSLKQSSSQISKVVYNPHDFDDELLELFKPNPPLPILPPLEENSDEIMDQVHQTSASVAMPIFEEYKEQWIKNKREKVPHQFRFQAEAEKQNRKMIQREIEFRENMRKWAMNLHVESNNKTIEPYHTLFVSRLNFNITESKLKSEFECYGPIRQCFIVKDLEGKSCGYGFIEFINKEDMIKAFQNRMNKTIDNEKIIVDVERGRTVEGWRPRKLGGGMGLSRPPFPKKSERMMSVRGGRSGKRGSFGRGFGRGSPPMKRRRF